MESHNAEPSVWAASTLHNVSETHPYGCVDQ